jgi:hypothetical protein
MRVILKVPGRHAERGSGFTQCRESFRQLYLTFRRHRYNGVIRSAPTTKNVSARNASAMSKLVLRGPHRLPP